MEPELVAFCGLNCKRCQAHFKDIREKANALTEAMDHVNFSEIAKLIPFMNFKYKRFKKVIEFISYECPGCREGGGNPFCGIRKCAKKRNYFTCAECEQLCRKFKSLFKVHSDNEIQDNIAFIKERGLDRFIEHMTRASM